MHLFGEQHNKKKSFIHTPLLNQPTRKKERILLILLMISSSSHLLSGSFIVSFPPPRGGRNVSSSSNSSNNNNNNNNNTLLRRRTTTKSNKKQRHQNQGRSSKFFVTEAGRRGKAKEDLSSSLKVGEKIKIPIVGVEVPKPKLPAKVEAMVSGNERTIGIVLASLAIVKVRFGGRNKKNRRGSMGRLEERGMLDENREVDEEKFFKGMMKTVRTVDMPERTEQQIMAARERRRASRAGDANLAKELETVEIPANHPFASNEKLDAAQEAERKKKIIDANSPRRRTRPAAPKQK